MKNHNQSKKILIIEDDPSIVDSMKILLEMEGYAVQTMTEVKSIERIRKIFPDLILLDVWMSGQDGLDIAKSLKKQKNTKNIPIVLVSASKDIIRLTKEAGVEDFLEKPFEMDDLINKVEKYIPKSSN